jgi:ATP-dependent helicase HrpA
VEAQHAPASYEQLHLSMLAGLLGNIGQKNDTEDWYLGARGIKFHRHPGANLSKKPGRWIVCAELVETARLFGRGIANIEPQWLEQVGEHLLKKQLLDPHWEKKAARCRRWSAPRSTAWWSTTSGGWTTARSTRPARARSSSAKPWWAICTRTPGTASCPSWPPTAATVREVQELEHKSRRQDVLVDDELIYAFYDQQLPADVCSGASFERWYREASRATRSCCSSPAKS